MKRLFVLIFLSVMVLLVFAPVIALAEAATGTTDMQYDWAMLGTIAGATAATLLIVQFIKAPVDKIGHIPTRALVYIIAFLILLGAQAFTVGLTLPALPLIVVNAFVVALAAMGSYEATFARLEDKKPPDDPDNPA